MSILPLIFSPGFLEQTFVCYFVKKGQMQENNMGLLILNGLPIYEISRLRIASQKRDCSFTNSSDKRRQQVYFRDNFSNFVVVYDVTHH